MRISFLIPAYNERGTILEVLDRIEALGLDRQLIVIDDGSTDGTSDLLREWQQGREGGLVLAASVWLLLLGTDINVGYGMALLVLIATNLVLVLPSSPAALGAFEAAVVVALGAYGVERAEALSFALVLHARVVRTR